MTNIVEFPIREPPPTNRQAEDAYYLECKAKIENLLSEVLVFQGTLRQCQ